MTVIHTFTTPNTERQAFLFSISLAEKGWTSEVLPTTTGHIVVASDERAVRFDRS